MDHIDRRTWRTRQRAFDDRDHEDLPPDRTTALQVRPLVERYVTQFLVAEFGGAALHTVSELPRTKIENDQRSVVFTQPIQDYVACKAFRVQGVAAIFVLTIGLRRVRLQLVTQRFRLRGQILDPHDQRRMRWLPPGHYTLWTDLAQATWSHPDQAEPALQQLFSQAAAQKSLIRRAAQQAAFDVYRAAVVIHGKQILQVTGYLALLLAYGGLVLWCLLARLWV